MVFSFLIGLGKKGGISTALSAFWKELIGKKKLPKEFSTLEDVKDLKKLQQAVNDVEREKLTEETKLAKLRQKYEKEYFMVKNKEKEGNLQEIEKQIAEVDEETKQKKKEFEEKNKALKDRQDTLILEKKAAQENINVSEQKIITQRDLQKKVKSDEYAEQRYRDHIIQQFAQQGKKLSQQEAEQIRQERYAARKLRSDINEQIAAVPGAMGKGMRGLGSNLRDKFVDAKNYMTHYDEIKNKEQAEALKQGLVSSAKLTAKATIATGALAAKAISGAGSAGAAMISGGYDLLIIGALLWHFAIKKILFNFQVTPETSIVEFVIFLFVWIIMNNTWGKRIKSFIPLFIIFGLEIGWLNYLIQYMPSLLTNQYTQYFFVKWAWPYWALYFMFMGETEESPSWIVYLSWMAWILFWVSILIGPTLIQSYSVELPSDTAGKLATQLEEQAEQSGWIKGIKCFWETSMIMNPTAFAQGKSMSFEECMNPKAKEDEALLAGEIDKTITKYSKVTLTTEKQEKEFGKESAVPWVKLTIENEEQKIKVNSISCHFKDKDNKITQGKVEWAGKISKPYEQLEEPITCSDNGKLGDGSYTTIFEITLNELDNIANWDVFFMNKDSLKGVVGFGTNDKKFKEMSKKWPDEVSKVVGGLFENRKKVVSKCGQGMVCPKLGELKETLPIYGINKDTKILFDTRVKNIADGEIIGLGNVTLSIPKGFGLSPECKSMTLIPKEKEHVTLHNEYTVKYSDSLSSIQKLGEKKERSINRCFLIVKNIEEIYGSGNNPTLNNFQLEFTDYKYKLKKEVGIKVSERGASSDSYITYGTLTYGDGKFPKHLRRPEPMTSIFGSACDVSNYKSIEFPIIGKRLFNPKAAPSFQRALQKIKNDGYAGLIRLNDFGGTYNCRLVRGSTTSTSPHSWGVAMDFNVHMGPNATYSNKQITDYNNINGPIVGNFKVPGEYAPLKYLAEKYFEPEGIAWGGRWTNTPDAMHFEATKAG